tara:strand:+ start:59 stop:2275 length:2217 start_codon:yes stop_codon:yes gene_type:complete
MRYLALFNLFFLSIIYDGVSQNSIKLKFVNNIDGSPIDSLEISIDNKSYFTDNNGVSKYNYKSLPFIISIEDYRFYKKKIEILDSNDKEFDVINRGIVLDDIIVNSELFYEKLKKISLSKSVLNDIEFKKNNGDFIINTLSELPGIHIHSAGYNTNRITIRGMGSRSPYSTNKIKAYLNNIPLSNGVGELNLEDFSLDILDQIEVNKGPNSSTYGSGLGGNIILSTTKLYDKTIKIKSIFKSFSTYQNSLSISKKINDLSFFINFEKIKSDGFRDNNKYDNNKLFASISYKINSNYNFGLIHFYNSADALIPSSLSQENFVNDPSSAAFSWRNVQGGEDYSRSVSGLTFNINNDEYSSKTSIFYKTFKNEENRPFNYLIEDSNIFGIRHIGKFKLIPFELSYGLEYSHENYLFNTWDDFGNINQSMLTQQTQDRINYNLFLQFDKSFENSFLTFGLGSNNIDYDWVDDINSNSLTYSTKTILSPRISYNFSFKKSSIFANVSHGFSSPNIDETLDDNGLVNPDIKPETGWNYEIGLIGSNNRKTLSYNLNLYYMDIKNLLVAQRTSFDTFTGVNAGRTSHPGLEAIINFPILIDENFKITSSNSFSKYWYLFKDFNNRGIDFSKNKLTGVPNYTSYSKIKIDFKNYIVQISFTNVGKIPINDANELFTDAFSIFDLKLSRLISFKNFNANISSGINNILDKKYASGVVINARSFGGRDPRYYYPGLPRNYYLSLAFNL